MRQRLPLVFDSPFTQFYCLVSGSKMIISLSSDNWARANEANLKKEQAENCHLSNYSTGHHIAFTNFLHGSFSNTSLGEQAKTLHILKIFTHLQGRDIIFPIFKNLALPMFYATKQLSKGQMYRISHFNFYSFLPIDVSL